MSLLAGSPRTYYMCENLRCDINVFMMKEGRLDAYHYRGESSGVFNVTTSILSVFNTEEIK